MLKSLFGDLLPLREAAAERDEARDFASTAILEEVTDEVIDGREYAPRPLHDLFVTDSPTQTMRAHFAQVQATEDRRSGARVITLLDPAQMWAGAVVKALADASGSPVERLHLRDQTSLSTLAVIERITLSRRQDTTLKIYHADVRAPGAEASAIPFVLMERSDLAAIVIGPLPPSGVDELLMQLRGALASSSWNCPHLLFLLPVGAQWIANKVDSMAWPAGVQVSCRAEPLTSASSVWNQLLAHWNGLAAEAESGPVGAGQPTALTPSASTPAASVPAAIGATPSSWPNLMPVPPGPAPAPWATGAPSAFPTGGGLRGDPGASSFGFASAFAPTHPPSLSPDPHHGSVHTSNTTTVLVGSGYPSPTAAYPEARDSSAAPAASETGRRPADLQRANAILHELMLLDGLIFAALVDVHTGEVIASEGRGPDIDRAALASSEMMRTHRRTLRQMGHARSHDPVDEVLVTAGSRYHILRTLQGNPDRFILAVLDKLRSNLAMTRFRIMEAQQSLS